ncbi:hypothetical protein SLEP1_g47327 [Rubroshorea leprosula]|uniref:Rab3GAP catalytic subunit conserved domain-containing protein n=1 Tax=Rubroshorea leprosula TaxID=152421 RepID=A0AAV5LR08_9ROSI|nr:hypothetical protein SLEP1_g47327 [Rubroshorea leprosula]
MEPPSFVSKARTAIHSAAAKAERVFTEFKSDRDSDKIWLNDESTRNEVEAKSQHEVKQFRWRPGNLGTKEDWQKRFKNIRLGRKGVEDSEKVENSEMAVVFCDENLYLLNMKNDLEAKNLEAIPSVDVLNASSYTCNLPPTSVIEQLAAAVESGKKFKSMKDLLASSRESSPIRDRTGLSLSAVKSLVLRDKEGKITSSFADDERVLALIRSLFNTEGKFLRRKIDPSSDACTALTSLPRDIHGAPPESFVVKLSEVIGSFKSFRRMGQFWCKVVDELKRLWSEEQHIPGIPVDGIPDLDSCLLYQQLQVFNCCISRKRRRSVGIESLDSVISGLSSTIKESAVSTNKVHETSFLYARVSSGELVLRLGANNLADNLTMLETGEPIYSPVTQEGPLLTEDLIRETEEFVLRTGSVGAGCSQLLSDMQAFKAANPGCVLEDFVRWHSPPDWTDSEPSDDADTMVTKGQLSRRMQKEGNLWHKLWETAKPIPAFKQTPLFDEDLAVEGILNFLDDIPPSELFQQLFVSVLGLGFVLAEAKLCTDGNLSKLFYECKDYVVATCQGGSWNEKLENLSQVYKTVETLLLSPEEVLKSMKPTEEIHVVEPENPESELKRRIKKLGLNFGGKIRQQPNDQKNSDQNSIRQPFSSFFDSKSSLFSKKHQGTENLPPACKTLSPDENDWTLV